MEFLFALPVLLLPLGLPLISGHMAKNFGRSFWLWFVISIPLPLISLFLLACLPDKSAKMPVDNEEIFKIMNGIS